MQDVINKSNSAAASAVMASKCSRTNPSVPTMDDQMTVFDDHANDLDDEMTKLEEATTVLADTHYVPTEVPSDDDTELDRMMQPQQKKLRRM